MRRDSIYPTSAKGSVRLTTALTKDMRPLDYWFRYSRNANFSARAIFWPRTTDWLVVGWDIFIQKTSKCNGHPATHEPACPLGPRDRYTDTYPMISALPQARHVKDLGECSARAPADIILPNTKWIYSGSEITDHGDDAGDWSLPQSRSRSARAWPWQWRWCLFSATNARGLESRPRQNNALRFLIKHCQGALKNYPGQNHREISFCVQFPLQ